MNNISFIIPNRGATNLPFVIKNIKNNFKDFNPEIIIVHQDDNTLFKRGQLFNIGYSFIDSENLILTDNDIIYFYKIDFDLIYNKFKTPFSCFKHLQHVYLKNDKLINGEFKKK